jgi:ribonuclease HI
LVAYIDGGARGNPGPAGFGVRVEQADGTLVEEFSESIGVATNNVAEYRGLLAALQWARAKGLTSLHVRSDSLLMVQQMLGNYKVKNAGLQPLHAKARLLTLEIGRVTFEHVERAKNAHADRLANQAMDAAAHSALATEHPAPAPGTRHPAPAPGTRHSAPAPGTRHSAPAPSTRHSTPAAAAHPFTELERAVRLFIYRHFVDTASAPDIPTIARGMKTNETSIAAALRTLADGHAIVLAPASLAIWMAHPFSAVPTPYPVDANGRTYWANCAWDAAGILSLVGDGETQTLCADCGQHAGFGVQDGALVGDGVVHYLVPPRKFWDNVAYT